MKCVILGAGLGNRLYPLTQNIPKPMMPVANRPILEHILLAVKQAGIQDICINLYYRPECMIDYFGDGSQFGVHITWRHEQTLSGPAGALLIFADILQDDEVVLVISGDALQDIDLQAFLSAHKQMGAALTVAMKEVQNPGRYGVGSIDDQGFLTSFVEKPPIRPDAYGLVSCGIYCFNPTLFRFFRHSGLYDFGADLIPTMISMGEPVFGFKTPAYWADIGTPKVLLDANLAAIEERVKLTLPGILLSSDGIRSEPDCVIDDSAELKGPIQLGKAVHIGPEVRLVGPVVVGAHARIEKGVYIGNSVLLPGARVAEHSIVIEGLVATNQQKNWLY